MWKVILFTKVKFEPQLKKIIVDTLNKKTWKIGKCKTFPSNILFLFLKIKCLKYNILLLIGFPIQTGATLNWLTA